MLSIVPVRARNSAGFKVVIWRILSGDSPVLAKLVKLLVNRLARCLSLPLFEGKFLEHRNPDGQRSGLRRLLVRKRVSKVAGRKAKEASSISGRRCCLDRMGLRTKCRHGRPASSSISSLVKPMATRFAVPLTPNLCLTMRKNYFRGGTPLFSGPVSSTDRLRSK
jgi:hypothetical protein